MARRVLHDEYFRRAKAEGYLARSAYKLKEINQRHRVLRPGGRVLDLGCAPGSWMQVARQIVGPKGLVLGVDLAEVDPRIVRTMGENVRAVQADAWEIEPARLVEFAGGPFDALVSDMAPNTSGHGDHERSVRLCHRVLDLAPDVVRANGHLVMKVFEGGMFKALLERSRKMFHESKGFKPRASRDVSTELYVVAFRLRESRVAMTREMTTGEPDATGHDRPGEARTEERVPDAAS